MSEPILGWNYRVMRHTWKAWPDVEIFQIHEVYYDEDGSPGTWTLNSKAPRGTSLDELREDFRLMTQAFERPVLDYPVHDDDEESS